MHSICLINEASIPDARALAEYMETDATRFPKAPGWRAAAQLLVRATLEPEGLFPLQRNSYDFVSATHPFSQFNSGVSYADGRRELAVLDSVEPAIDGMGLTNLELGGWIAYTQRYRAEHEFPAP
ncbi:MAG TPA: hypothetical protein VLI54_05890 [Bacillota bacterium]|nr:hypothetical protein [Bacillota bacterium]